MAGKQGCDFCKEKKKKRKRHKCNKSAQKYTKNENFFNHFFTKSTVMRASRRPTIYIAHICGALRDLVPLVQFKKRENTHGGVLILVKLQA